MYIKTVMQSVKQTNIYDKLLILLIFLTGFGGIGGALQLSRIAAVLLFPLMIIRYGKCRYIKSIVTAMVAFYAYCLLSYIWTPDKEEAVKELVYYPVHFILFSEILVFAKYANKSLRSISLGWFFAITMCCIIALWEISTGNHLSVTKEQKEAWNTGVEILNYMRSNSTFYNSNGFVTYLCYGLPWLYFGISISKSFIRKIPYIAFGVSAIVIIMLNASRGGLLTIFVMGIIAFFFSIRNRRKSFYFIILLIPVVFLIYYFYTNSMFAVLISRISDGNSLGDESRLIIWKNALLAFGDTYGLGTGIGSMEISMEKYAHGGIAITHNIFLEILLQYGVLFFVMFIVFLMKQLKKTIHLKNERKVSLLMALVSFPIYGIINSGYLLETHLYVLMATIYVFANYERIKYIHKELRQVA